LIPLDEARAYVLDGCAPLPAAEVTLSDALVCVAAERVVALEPLPPFANTAMDGYAVRAADTASVPVELDVVGYIAAGASGDDVHVGDGQAARIMTGAPMPAGADAIVMVECTEELDGGTRVRIDLTVDVGTAVRPAGDDLQPGDPVVEPGAVLTPAHLGLLATVGRASVSVVRRPRVGVLSTGDELVDGDAPLGPGQIRDSNRPTLLALVRQAGFDAVDLGTARDDEATITSAIENGVASCDALLTSGGVSMGDLDYVKVVLDRIGEMRWMQIAIRPAKPLAFGTVPRPSGGEREARPSGGEREARPSGGEREARPSGGRVPVFGLPGNPVSTVVGFELFLRPALLAMQGARTIERPRATVRVAGGYAKQAGRAHYLRAHVVRDGEQLIATPHPKQGSAMLSSLVGCNALVVIAAELTELAPGAPAPAILMEAV
jgi:molybdopterin molybdotransferase